MIYPFAGISYNQKSLSLLLWKNGRRNTEDNPKTHEVVYLKSLYQRKNIVMALWGLW